MEGCAIPYSLRHLVEVMLVEVGDIEILVEDPELVRKLVFLKGKLTAIKDFLVGLEVYRKEAVCSEGEGSTSSS